MSGLRLSALVLVVACGEPGLPMSRLTQAWAAQTVERASPPITTTLLLAGLAAELCAGREGSAWTDLESGEPLPITDALDDALGGPQVYSVEGLQAGATVVVVDGVDLSDHPVEWLRLTVTVTAELFQVAFDPLVADGADDVAVARMESVGQIGLVVNSGCSASQAWVSGSALLVDNDGRRHELKLPADSDLGSDLNFDGQIPWLPMAGAISWSSRIEGQDRSLVTADAAEILVDGVGHARWPVTVRGPDWQGSGLSEISP